jgi:hypothetical protein
MTDDYEPGPHTEGGYRDMLAFGKCMERRDDNGVWYHIPFEEWSPSYVPEPPK